MENSIVKFTRENGCKQGTISVIEIGQILLRKDDRLISSEVVGRCLVDGIQHYHLKVLGGTHARDLVLSEHGLKLAYRLPRKSWGEKMSSIKNFNVLIFAAKKFLDRDKI